MTTSLPSSAPIKRQISLPLSKAVEIAYRNIRVRLGRSLLVTSGIVLALAFLMSVLTGDAVTGAMRGWSQRVIAASASSAHGSSGTAGSVAKPAGVNTELTDALRLESTMKNRGVPITPAEIRDDQIQHRWMIGLALLVAFVGILNAMLMSVTERFREIGTMKCLGALDSFIVKLFLIESLFQGACGTVIGVLLGVSLSLISLTVSYGGFAWREMPAGQIAMSAAVCLIVGIGLTVAAAVYPAWQAARMHPIEAMRVET